MASERASVKAVEPLAQVLIDPKPEKVVRNVPNMLYNSLLVKKLRYTTKED
jgi:hypothetical protein